MASKTIHKFNNQNQIIMKKIFTFFAALAAVVCVNAQNVDYEALGFIDNATDQNVITEMQLSMTDTLNVNLVVVNNGPDELAAGDSLKCTISIEGLPLASGGFNYATMSQNNLLAVGTPWIATLGLFDPATMNQYSDFFPSEFDLCITLSNNNATDVDPSNNQACIHVYRGNVGLENAETEGINVYPNPATDVIYVANAEGAQVSVFDMNGRMVSSVESASANQQIDASSLAKGMYIVRIVDGQNVTTKKVSVVR